MSKFEMKRTLAAIIACAAVVTASGCGNNEKSTSSYKLTDGKSSGEAQYAVTEEPVELSFFFVRQAEGKLEDTEVYQEIAKQTNIKLKTVTSESVSDEMQAFNTLMASGEIPDIVALGNGRDSFSQYGIEGAFAKIDTMISDKTPNLKNKFAQANIKNYITASDGHVYYIPNINPKTVAEGWMIRKDWLDKLGLSVPTSTEEYYQVLKAFREKDPNGNGKKDEIPYFSRFTRVDDLLGLWNVWRTWDIKDGKVFYSPLTTQYRDAYANLGKWYAEGLIDKEIFTRGSKSRDKLFGDNVGGSTHDWFATTVQFNSVLAKQVHGFHVIPFAPPTGVEYFSRPQVGNGGVAISESSDKKEVALRFYDFIYSTPGQKFTNFGIEGKQYDVREDGKEYFKDFILHGEKDTINILREFGVGGPGAHIQDFWYEEQWLEPEAKAGVREYLDNDYLRDPFPNLSYTTEEKKEFDKIMGPVTTLMAEYMQKWVFGTEDPMTTFDTFVQKAKSMGADKAVEIQQKAYDRFLKNSK